MISRVDLEQIACALEFEGRPSAADQVRDTATQLEAMQAEIDRYRSDLSGIANAVRLGAASDIQAWANLANACQQTARASLDRQGK